MDDLKTVVSKGTTPWTDYETTSAKMHGKNWNQKDMIKTCLLLTEPFSNPSMYIIKACTLKLKVTHRNRFSMM